MKLLRKTTLTILSFLFLLSLVFAFNFNAESIYADAALIEMNGTTYTSIQDAIDSAPYDIETEIKLYGDISITNEIKIYGSSTLGVKKIILNIINNSKFSRPGNGEYSLFNINQFGNLKIITSNSSKLVVDYNKTNFDNKDYPIINNSGTLTLNGDITLKNSFVSVSGAAIRVSAGALTTLNNVNFENNNSNDKGGAISNNGNLIINNCNFINNSAGSWGGAICNMFGTINLSNCNFEENIITSKQTLATGNVCYGGAIAIYSGSITIDTCKFTNNNSHMGVYVNSQLVMGHGGAIAVYGGTASILDAIFEGNNAYNGGAISVTGGRLNVTNMTMTDNIALYEAGGIYVNGGIVQISDGTIKNNVAPTGRAQDVYFVTSSASSCLFGAKITSENKYAIYSSQDFVVGKNFAISGGSYINLENDKKIIVKEQLVTSSPILIGIIGASDDELVGKPLVAFANQAAITRNVFTLSNPDYSLVLPTDYESLTEPYLFVSIEYTIEFYKYYDAETGIYSELISQQKIKFGENAVAPTEAEVGVREGYVFGGWSSNKYTNVKESIKIYAIWGQKIKITYKVFNDSTNRWEELPGLTDEQKTIVSGSQILDLPSIPNKTGYTTHEPYWAYDQNGDTPYNNENVDEAMTLYAIYIPDILKITFIREDGSTIEIEVEYNTSFTDTIPTIATKTGYDQVAPYWAYDQGGEKAFDASKIIKTSFNLYEIYKINRYNVEFYVNFYHNLNAETGKELLECKKVHEMMVDYNTIIEMFPSLPANAAFTQNQVEWDYQNAPIVDNTKIYGGIDINVYLVKFEVDGEITNSYNVEHGKTLETVPVIPEKTGYNQVAPTWVLAGVSIEDVVTSNLTFVAKYTQNIYTVTFVLPDGSKVLRNVRHGESVNADNIISKGFGELIRFDRSLDNITEDCEIHVSKVNLFMWIMIALGGILLLVLLIIVIKIIKKKKLQSIARKKHKHTRNRVGPFVTGDDE